MDTDIDSHTANYFPMYSEVSIEDNGRRPALPLRYPCMIGWMAVLTLLTAIALGLLIYDRTHDSEPVSTGVVGAVGPAGVKGDKGNKGDKGEKGSKGNRGDNGDKGTAGEKGEKGRKGDTGDRGLKGDKGEKGIKGDKGAKGDKGEVGLNGVSGTDGPKGDKGDKGEKGLEGIKGDKGDKGEGVGAKGDKGEKGTTGTQGIQGIQGVQGDKGEKGTKGDKGEKGDKGDKGTKGDKGEKGDKGDKGAKGDQGIQGIQGVKGDKGEKGEGVGDKGEKGDKGNTGSAGDDGEKGEKGDAGGAPTTATCLGPSTSKLCTGKEMDTGSGDRGVYFHYGATESQTLAMQSQHEGAGYRSIAINPLGGNVCVGCPDTAPANKLDVRGGLSVGSSYAGVSAAPTDGCIIQNTLGVGTSTPDTTYKIHTTGSIKTTSVYSTGLCDINTSTGCQTHKQVGVITSVASNPSVSVNPNSIGWVISGVCKPTATKTYWLNVRINGEASPDYLSAWSYREISYDTGFTETGTLDYHNGFLLCVNTVSDALTAVTAEFRAYLHRISNVDFILTGTSTSYDARDMLLKSGTLGGYFTSTEPVATLQFRTTLGPSTDDPGSSDCRIDVVALL